MTHFASNIYFVCMAIITTLTLLAICASSDVAEAEIEFSNITTSVADKTIQVKINTTTAKPSQERTLRRGKRYLDFIEGTKMFFRINGKNNIVRGITIWAHAYGFRANLAIERNEKARPYRRDTFALLGKILDLHGFDGQACLLKAFCSANYFESKTTTKRQGMLFRLLEFIFTLSVEDKHHFPYLRMENCEQILHSHCPLSFNSLSPYTDDI